MKKENTKNKEKKVLENTEITNNSLKFLSNQKITISKCRDDFPERDDSNWLKHSIYFSSTKSVSKREVNFRPKTVQSFQPAERTY